MISININGLTLCHKGSGGVTHNTLPDVCKTPGLGIPVPYQNEAYSSDLTNGTSSVFADGGNMIANFGSKFARSVFDEPGSMGGVISGTNKAEADWISHSFDVFFEKKPACRLTDKMWMNHRNTVNMAGLHQAPLDAIPEIKIICKIICICNDAPIKSVKGLDLRQECVEKSLLVADDALNHRSTIKPEIPYNMTTLPPTPLLSTEDLNNGVIRATRYLPTRMIKDGLKSAAANGGEYMVRIPDAVIMRDPFSDDLTMGNLKGVVEIKFTDPWNSDQLADYAKIVGDPNKVIELSPSKCLCDEPEPEREKNIEKAAEEARKAQETQEEKSWWDKFGDTVGLSGGALVLYAIFSEGSRLFPPRNAIPVP